MDVRDFAEAHLLVLTKPEAGGERYIIAAGTLPVVAMGYVALIRSASYMQHPDPCPQWP